MDIKKTGLIKQVMGLAKNTMANNQASPNDSLSISDKAKFLAKMDAYKKMVLLAPDVRNDKISEAKARLESGYYSSKEVYKIISDKLDPFLKEEEEPKTK